MWLGIGIVNFWYEFVVWWDGKWWSFFIIILVILNFDIFWYIDDWFYYVYFKNWIKGIKVNYLDYYDGNVWK